ncbi:MAG TPA: hypothetical protein VEA69_02690 [Tepidisphaeraceae bacterium]|nr:hypothetical protein [Tepidisphaeraceae bacterium]
MRFCRTPANSRSTVLHRHDALCAARADDDADRADGELFEHIILTGRTQPACEQPPAPEKVTTQPPQAKQPKNSQQNLPAVRTSTPTPPQPPAKPDTSDKRKLSPFETELLEAWSEC